MMSNFPYMYYIYGWFHKGEILYVGCTNQPDLRRNAYRCDAKHRPDQQLIIKKLNEVGFDNCEFIVLEEADVTKSKAQLLEGEWVDIFRTTVGVDLLNEREHAGLTVAEWKQHIGDSVPCEKCGQMITIRNKSTHQKTYRCEFYSTFDKY
tara:strand:+ start:652 stop:1101 length:450 start_codon:yes stop_codon:yes gene_type:complete